SSTPGTTPLPCASTTPLDATLTKNQGWASLHSSQLSPNLQPATASATPFLFSLSTLNCRLSTSSPWPIPTRAVTSVSPLSATLTKNTGATPPAQGRRSSVSLPRYLITSLPHFRYTIASEAH